MYLPTHISPLSLPPFLPPSLPPSLLPSLAQSMGAVFNYWEDVWVLDDCMNRDIPSLSFSIGGREGRNEGGREGEREGGEWRKKGRE